jgi:tetratricopeptide (TPR) repeat protein
MLSQDDQQVLATLLVFPGSFGKEAAQTIASASLLQLARLVNKSLIHHTAHGRYTIHGLLRQYLRSTVSNQTSEHSRCAAHARYYLSWLCGQAAHPMERARLDEIGEEIDNLRAAWQWAVLQGEVASLGAAANPLYQFYAARNWFSEGESIFRQAAISLVATADRLVYAKVAARQASFCHQLGDDARARDLLEQSMAIASQLGHPRKLAFAQLGLAALALRQGDYANAQQAARSSLEAYQALGDELGMAQALNRLADALTKSGHYQEAASRVDQALALTYKQPMPALEAESRHLLVSICWNQGDYGGAQSNYQRACELYSAPQVANRQGEAEALNQLGFVAWSQAD